MDPVRILRQAGQSLWLDFIRRTLITSGGLAGLVSRGWITGVTSNPSIFRKAISGGDEYGEEIRVAALEGVTDPYDAFVMVGGEDIRLGADVLRPVYETTRGVDGYISLEVPPSLAHDEVGTVAEAKRLSKIIDRPNAMIKVPGTPAGVAALEELTAAGVNVNQTLLFSVKVYEATADAYLRGLERRLDAGLPVSGIGSVASFFVSRLDTAADPRLPDELKGKTAIANAKLAYRRFEKIFSGERWERLELAGALPQRPLWASTSTKNPDYPDTLYVDSLVAPNTVNTVPEPTLEAFADHGNPDVGIDGGPDPVEVLDAVGAAGVDLDELTETLLEEGLDAFAADFEALTAMLEESLKEPTTYHTVPAASVMGQVEELAATRAVSRLWERDHTLWADDPAAISSRLEWLDAPERAVDMVGELQRFAAEISTDGRFARALLLGMGGSSLTAEVMAGALEASPGRVELQVLDTTDPAEIMAAEAASPLSSTLFVVASKSGTTLETLSLFRYFWSKIPDGENFVAITDPGTPLEDLARRYGFRSVFYGDPEIGGRYSALSRFGLVPAAIMGAGLEDLISSATEMRLACREEPERNPGLLLGAFLGKCATEGRDKLTLVLPGTASALGDWIEQLVAESTGKDGKGILPLTGEELADAASYAGDRQFVSYVRSPRLEELEQQGHPVLYLDWAGTSTLGAEFFRWEVGVALAGSMLAINPFDQPDVERAKSATARILETGTVELPKTLSLKELLGDLEPGGYLAIQAYLPRNRATVDAFQTIRTRLWERYGIPVTVGFGPRYLHSTGQFHKGGPRTGSFIQVVGADPDDLEIPGVGYSFGTLKHAQALGDLEALTEIGRPVCRTDLDELRKF